MMKTINPLEDLGLNQTDHIGRLGVGNGAASLEDVQD